MNLYLLIVAVKGVTCSFFGDDVNLVAMLSQPIGFYGSYPFYSPRCRYDWDAINDFHKERMQVMLYNKTLIGLQMFCRKPMR